VNSKLDKLRALYSLGIVSLFTLFLAASQPHRVHHLLENLASIGPSHVAGGVHDEESHPDDHVGPSAPFHAHNNRPDANHDGRPKTDCATQGIVKHAPLASDQSPNIFSYDRVFLHWRMAASRVLTHSSRSPISPRAPPQQA
jgi:hypothetical protein